MNALPAWPERPVRNNGAAALCYQEKLTAAYKARVEALVVEMEELRDAIYMHDRPRWGTEHDALLAACKEEPTP